MGFRADMRAAAVTLLNSYKAANNGALRQVYPGRPASIYTPCAFVDLINETGTAYGAGPTQIQPSLEIILIQGLFDSEDAVDQQDALVDGFRAHVRSNIHASGASTLVAERFTASDIPNYQPDWIPDAPIYYATRVTLEGLKLEGGVV
jgi:hypothetical protein